jgi:hypothetical protein
MGKLRFASGRRSKRSGAGRSRLVGAFFSPTCAERLMVMKEDNSIKYEILFIINRFCEHVIIINQSQRSL